MKTKDYKIEKSNKERDGIMKRLISFSLVIAIIFTMINITAAWVYAGAGDVYDNPVSFDGRPDVVAKWVLEPAGAVRKIPGNQNPIANTDGSRTFTTADDFGMWGMDAALPQGLYFMKFFMYVKRGTANVNEGDRIIFMGTAGGDVAINNLSAYPDAEWSQIIVPFVVSAEKHNVMSEYRIKGPMPWLIGDGGFVKIGREVVISTNNAPLTDHEVAAAYFVGPEGNTTYTGAVNKDYSITSTTSGNMVGFNADLPAGTYWLKLTTRTSGKSGDADLTAPAARLTSTEGIAVDFPALSDYQDGVWQNNYIKFTTAGGNFSYNIVAPQNGAIDFSIAKNMIISKNDKLLDPPQNGMNDFEIRASHIGKDGNVCKSPWGNLYNKTEDAFIIPKTHGSDRFVYDLLVRASNGQFINSGYVPRGKFYVKILAKVPVLATNDTDKDRTIFNVEKDEGQGVHAVVSGVKWGEFTQADTYQTIVKEFDASLKDYGNDIWLQCRFLSGVSDLDVKKIVVSSNSDPLQEDVLETGISWPTEQLLPSFAAPAPTMIAIDMTDGSFEDIVTARCLQGLINRTRPRIYVREPIEGGQVNADIWVNVPGINFFNIEGDNPRERLINLINLFKDEIGGYVKYNRSYIQTVNMATTISGIKDSIPLVQSQIDGMSSAMTGLSMTWDISALNYTHNSAGRVNASKYLRENFPGEYNDRVIMNINPGVNGTSSTDLGRANTLIRDLAVALKIPVVYLDAKTTAERNEVTNYYNAMKTKYSPTANIGFPIALGFFPSEGEGIAETSSHGITHVPTDNFGNYTVYSGLPREVDPPSVPKKPDLGNYHYVSMIVSDGDNICLSQGCNMIGSKYSDRRRGEAVLGWTFAPAMLDAAPQIMQYYYGTATDGDAFLAGPSGLGYTVAYSGGTRLGSTQLVAPTKRWNDAWVPYYAANTNHYFELTNISSTTVWNSTNSTQRNAYSDFGVFPSLLGTYLQFQDGVSGGENGTLYWGNTRTPMRVFNVNYDDTAGITKVKSAVNGISKSAPANPAFYSYQMFTISAGYGDFADLQRDAKASNQYIQFVRPDHYFMLINEANGKPINNALQASTLASGSDYGFDSGKAVDGSFGKTHGWQSSAAGEKWLTVDFERRVDMSRYVLKNAETIYYSAAHNTQDYEIQVSNDGRNWTTLDSVTGNTEAIVYRDLDPQGEKYRFARVYITNPGVDGVARIQDIEIYGVNSNIVDKTELEAELDIAETITDQVSYNDNLWQNFKTAESVAQNVFDDVNATQVEVDEATLNLRDAIEALEIIDTTALDTALATAATKVENHYSAVTWATFDAAYQAAQTVKTQSQTIPMILTQDDVDAAVTALNSAISALAVDKTALAATIASAVYVESDYSTASWATYAIALTAANSINGDAAAKQYEVDTANTNLIAAIAGLSVDKTALNALVAEVNSLTEGDYSTASWAAVVPKLEAAVAVKDNASAKQSQIDVAYNELLTVKNALAVDKTQLQSVITEAQGKTEADYDETTWNNLQTRLTEAIAIEANTSAKQSQINVATANLRAAINGLLFDKSLLQAAIDSVDSYTRTDYSEASWEAMLEKLAEANSVNESDTPTQAEIETAKDELNAALAALTTDKSELAYVILSVDTLEETDYSEASWATMQEKLDVAEIVNVDAGAKQSEIESAKDELQAAIDALTTDKSDLASVISSVDTLEATDYSEASWGAMVEKLQAASEVNADTTAKQSEIDLAEGELQTAIDALTTDKSELADVIASTASLIENDYSEEAWEIFQEALQNANDVNNDAGAKQSEIESAKDRLEASIIGLTTDKTELIQLIEDAEVLTETDYSEASWAVLQEALQNANNVKDNIGSTQTEIEQAKEQLEDAINALTVDDSELEKLIEELKKLNSEDYLSETWTRLETLIKEAEDLLANSGRVQGAIDEIILKLVKSENELLLAIKNLADDIEIKVGEKIILNPEPSNGEWKWDEVYLNAVLNDSATFVALKEGTTVITYTTAQGVSKTVNVRIAKTLTPITSDVNFELPTTIAILFASGALVLKYRKKSEEK